LIVWHLGCQLVALLQASQLLMGGPSAEDKTLSNPCSDDSNRFAQLLTVLLFTAMSPYTFVKRL
jgi:hypothetical protein